MRAADTGLYCLGHASPLHIGVNLSATRLTLVAFKPIDRLERPIMSDLAVLSADILGAPSDAGLPKVLFEGHAVENPRQPGALLAYCSQVAFDLTDLRGIDEVVDFSRFEVPIDEAGLLATWDNRLITSRWDKNEYGRRNRAKRGAGIACYIWMPLATGSFHDSRIILPFATAFGLGGTADPFPLGGEEAASDVRGYLKYYWSAQAPEGLVVAPEGWIEIAVQLVENADGAPLAHATDLKIEVLSGYVTQLRVRTDDQGQALIRAAALGLRAGERLSVKINSNHYSAVGRIDVPVV